MPDITRSALLGALPHGFFGRQGGVSRGLASGLQCGFGGEDDQETVRENRRIAAEAILQGGVLVTPHQVHSPDVVTVTEPWSEERRPAADALVTRQEGLVLGIVTADCAPVLLADREAGVVGAAHAGWRGALGGVLENAVASMEALGARRVHIAAAIGPCIQQASYEVSADFAAAFAEKDLRFLAPGRPGHLQFDLPGYAASRLEQAGLTRIERLDLDTYSLEDRYFSFRRATHRDERNYGRQISLIALA